MLATVRIACSRRAGGLKDHGREDSPGFVGGQRPGALASQSHYPALLAIRCGSGSRLYNRQATAEEAREALGAKLASRLARDGASPAIDAVARRLRVPSTTVRPGLRWKRQHVYTEWPLGRTTVEPRS